jgi:caffeoyl-CoA O-methyltransferase
MDIVHPLAQTYTEKFSSGESRLLQAIAQNTYAHHEHSNMLSGCLQGRFLSLLSTLMNPSRILEIGTFVGYSALCLAEGLAENGRLHTIELREEDSATAKANFDKSELGAKIILHRGNALEILPTLNEVWDIVFIDADKTNYSNYYQMVFPHVRKGGLVIADNVLFHGQVLEDPIKGKNPLAIQQFNEMIKKDGSVDKVMLSVRDGLFLIYKK